METAYAILLNIDIALQIDMSQVLFLNRAKAIKVLGFGVLATVQILAKEEFRSMLVGLFKKN